MYSRMTFAPDVELRVVRTVSSSCRGSAMHLTLKDSELESKNQRYENGRRLQLEKWEAFCFSKVGLPSLKTKIV